MEKKDHLTERPISKRSTAFVDTPSSRLKYYTHLLTFILHRCLVSLLRQCTFLPKTQTSSLLSTSTSSDATMFGLTMGTSSSRQTMPFSGFTAVFLLLGLPSSKTCLPSLHLQKATLLTTIVRLCEFTIQRRMCTFS